MFGGIIMSIVEKIRSLSFAKKMLLYMMFCAACFILVTHVAESSKISYEKSEAVLFADNLNSHTKVYVDIVDIEPLYALYQSDNVSVDNVLCKCTTTSGSVVWIKMTPVQYNEHIDPDAKLNMIFNSSVEKTSFSSSPLRLEGKTLTLSTLPGSVRSKIDTKLYIMFERVISDKIE